MLSRYAILFSWVLLFSSVPTLSHAQSLVVLDCQGFTRAAHKTEPGLKSKVEVKVSSTGAPSNGAHLQLTNVADKGVIHTTSREGLARFENIAAGTYILSVLEPDLAIETVTIGSMGVGAIAAGGALLGAGAAVSGVAIGTSDLIDQIDGGAKSNEDIEPPLPTPAATPPAVFTPRTPAARPTPCPACNPDANPPSLDDQNDFLAAPSRALSPIE